MAHSAGKAFRTALERETPLQIVGAINAYAALLAERAGFQALYLSGAGVANACFGLPDLAVTSMNDVVQEASRITQAVDLPLLVDIDTGWGHDLMIQRTIKEMIRAGVAAVHMEDQVSAKRCGHRPGKELVSRDEMCARIRTAVAAKTDPDFVLMARTDALAGEGLEATIERIRAYDEAGADAFFLEAMPDLEHYQRFRAITDKPLLANITEFGKTPLFTTEQLGSVGINMVLYPLSAWRAMNRAAETVYHAIRSEGSQQSQLEAMQTREELYDVLNYHNQEQQLEVGTKHGNK